MIMTINSTHTLLFIYSVHCTFSVLDKVSVSDMWYVCVFFYTVTCSFSFTIQLTAMILHKLFLKNDIKI